ncbi:hypothetical protein J0H58_23470 [bacterium]|nr:hypothetical protein [bacterium]
MGYFPRRVITNCIAHGTAAAGRSCSSTSTRGPRRSSRPRNEQFTQRVNDDATENWTEGNRPQFTPP